jgi:hypothetical protein
VNSIFLGFFRSDFILICFNASCSGIHRGTKAGNPPQLPASIPRSKRVTVDPQRERADETGDSGNMKVSRTEGTHHHPGARPLLGFGYRVRSRCRHL